MSYSLSGNRLSMTIPETSYVQSTVSTILSSDAFLVIILCFNAVFFSYVFPFILIMLTLIITTNFVKEWIAGLVSLFILIPYYFMLFVLKDTFKKAFKISILKNN